MWIIAFLLIGVGLYFLLRASKTNAIIGSVIKTPLNTLKQLYAKGDIKRAEFDRRKK